MKYNIKGVTSNRVTVLNTSNIPVSISVESEEVSGFELFRSTNPDEYVEYIKFIINALKDGIVVVRLHNEEPDENITRTEIINKLSCDPTAYIDGLDCETASWSISLFHADNDEYYLLAEEK